MEITQEKIDEIVEAYDKAQSERRTTNTEQDYWQGRKDGLRVALAILEPEGMWKQLNKSSWGFQATEKEIITEYVKDIYYNVCDMVYSIRHKERIHPLTFVNIQNWIGSYHANMVRRGILPEIKDAINPFE